MTAQETGGAPAIRPAPPARGGSRPLLAGSMFSGTGGLDLAVEDVFGSRTIWFAETDPNAAKAYQAHWPGVPNLGDVAQIDWAQVEPVDVLCGGPPCQDLSHSGRMSGLGKNTRSGLWRFMAQAVGALRPSWVVLENVPGILVTRANLSGSERTDDGRRRAGDRDTGGAGGRGGGAVRGVGPRGQGLEGAGGGSERALSVILSDLAALGYDTVWCGLPASAAGACHLRRRVFLLAWPASGPAADPVRV
jgi:DNA (cytosine-5)-methyltransferase 1